MDLEAKKRALKSFHSGMAMLSARNGDRVAGATVTWFSQCSFEPPLIMVALRTDSDTYAAAKEAGEFAFSVFGTSQKNEAASFFKPTKIDGTNINGLEFFTGTSGAPILKTVPFWLECKIVSWVEQGDHHVAIGEVIAAGGDAQEESIALKSTGWSYGG